MASNWRSEKLSNGSQNESGWSVSNGGRNYHRPNNNRGDRDDHRAHGRNNRNGSQRTGSASDTPKKDTIPAFYKDKKGQLVDGEIMSSSGFGKLIVNTPHWIHYLEWMDPSNLNRALKDLIPHLNRDWISDRFSESLRKSASVAIKLRTRSNGKTKMQYRLRLPTERLFEHFQPQNRQVFMSHLEKWVVPTLQRFPKDGLLAITPDIRITTVEKRKNGKIIVPQSATSLDRLLDFHYISDYVYFYKAHDEWNQQFVPERVFQDNRCIYRLVLEVPPKFSLYSASRKLYLAIMQPEEFLAGETKRFRMTCDESRATWYTFQDRINGTSLFVEDMGVHTRYDLWFYDPSSMCDYPIYMGFSGLVANQSQLREHEQIAELLNRYRTLNAVTSASTVSATATATMENVDVNIFRVVSEGVMHHPTPPFLSSDLWRNNVLFHPLLPLLGFHSMSLKAAFEIVATLYNWVVHSRDRSDPGKIYFDVYLRHGHTQCEPFTYGIGCDPLTGMPTALNKSLLQVMDADMKRSWESVVLEVKLDYLSYLRLFPDCEGRYQWLTRVFSTTLSAEALRENKDYQIFKSQEVLQSMMEILSSLDEAATPITHSWTTLQQIEHHLLQRYGVDTFADLNLSQCSLLGFIDAYEHQCVGLLRGRMANVRTLHTLIETVGCRFLSTLDVDTASMSVVVKNVLRYYNVSDVSQLGYTSDMDLWNALRQRHAEMQPLSPQLTPLTCVTNLERLSSTTDQWLHEAGLAAVKQTRVLDNLLESTKWTLLFESSCGPLPQYLTTYTSIRFVEITHDIIIRLPDAYDDAPSAMEHYRTMLRSVFTSDLGGKENSRHKDRLLRQFVGAVVGLWALGDSEYSLTTCVESALRSIQQGCYRNGAEAASLVVEVVLQCLDLIPASIVQDIGKVMLFALSNLFQAELWQSLIANYQHKYELFSSAATHAHSEEEEVISAGAQWLMLRLAEAHNMGIHTYLQQLFGLVPVETVSRTPIYVAVEGSSSEWASFEETLYRAHSDVGQSQASEEARPGEVEDISLDMVSVDLRRQMLSEFMVSFANKYSLRWDAGQQAYLTALDNSHLHDGIHKAVTVIAQQLYSHQGRSIFELLQNADDCDYAFFDCDHAGNTAGNDIPTLNIDLMQDKLRLWYNEKGFEIHHVEAVSATNASTKIENLDQSGKKGIGFKSVFMISETPEVHSKGFHFKFHDLGLMGYLAPIQIDGNVLSEDIRHLSRQGTVLELPFRTTSIVEPRSNRHFATVSGADVYRLLQKQLQEMKPSLMLFLRRLRKIQVKYSIAYERVDRGFMRYIREIDSDGRVLRVHRWVLGDEEEEEETDGLVVQGNPVQVAIPLPTTQDTSVPYSEVYSLLPIRSYGLSFAVNGPFQLTASREDVIKLGSSPLNQELVSRLPAVFMKAAHHTLRYGCDGDRTVLVDCCSALLRAVPLADNVESEFKDTAKEIVRLMRKCACIPINKGESMELVSPETAVLLPDGAEWQSSLLISDVAYILSMGLSRTLIHDSTLATGFSTKRIPKWSALTSALGMRTLDESLLQEAFVSLWNKTALDTSDGDNDGDTDIISTGVLKRVWNSLFRMVTRQQEAQLITNLRNQLRVRVVVPATRDTPLTTVLMPLNECCSLMHRSESSSVAFIPAGLWQWSSTYVGLQRDQPPSAVGWLLQEVYGPWMASEGLTGILDPRFSEIVEEKLLVGCVATLPSVACLTRCVVSAEELTTTQLEFIALLWTWVTCVGDPGVNEVVLRVPTTTELATDLRQLLCSNETALRRLQETMRRLFPFVDDEVVDETALPPTVSVQKATEQAVQCLWRMLCEEVSRLTHEQRTDGRFDDHEEDVNDEDNDSVNQEEWVEEEEDDFQEEVNATVTQRLTQDAQVENRFTLIRNKVVGRLGEAFMFHTLQRHFPEADGFHVEWVNAQEEQGTPYDIVITRKRNVADGGSPITEEVAVVEVKATRRQRNTGTNQPSQIFELSVNEVADLYQRKEQYWLARVYGVQVNNADITPITRITGDREVEVAVAAVVERKLSTLLQNCQSNQRHPSLEFDLIRDAFDSLNAHRWQLVCAMFV